MRNIVGLYNGKGIDAQASRKLIKTMAGAFLQHRSTEMAIYVRGGVAFGEIRWRDVGDKQRNYEIVTNQKKSLVIVADADLTNLIDIQKYLKSRGCQLTGITPSEIILHLYEELGEDCIGQIRGSFAFAIWDKEKRRLFLARDIMGLRPLFYLQHGSMFYFSSQIGALLRVPGFLPSLSLCGVYQYFQFRYVPDPHTICDKVMRLPAAHYMTVDNDSLRIERYWSLDSSRKLYISVDACCERYMEILRSIVKDTVINDDLTGFAVSGGIDSWSIVCQASTLLDKPPMTFTMGFNNIRDPELVKSNLLSHRFCTKHYQVIMKHTDLIRLPTVFKLAGEPLNVFPALFLFYLTEFSARYAGRLVLGEGADEIFGGYGHQIAIRDIAALPRWYGRFGKLASLPAINRIIPRNIGQAWQTAHVPSQQLRSFYVREMGESISDLIFQSSFIKKRAELDGASLLETCFCDCKAGDIIDGTLYQDLVVYSYFRLADVSARAHGVPIACPYLDQNMVEFAFSLPSSYKISLRKGANENKILMRRALRRALPHDVISAEKVGFGEQSGLSSLIGSTMKEFAHHVLFQRRLKEAGIFRMTGIEKAFHRYLEGEKNLESVLWGLIFFEIWLEVALLGITPSDVEADLAQVIYHKSC